MTETRPSESDMITKPRAKAMTRQLERLFAEYERLREENSRLLELFASVEGVANDPGFQSDAMGWIAEYCWEARTQPCEKCQETGQARHIRGHLTDCDKCQGKGRV